MNKLKLFLDWLQYTPIISPILGLLRSRKFIAGVVTFAVDYLITQVPELEGAREQLIAATLVIAGLYIGGTALEDYGEKSASVTYNLHEDKTED